MAALQSYSQAQRPVRDALQSVVQRLKGPKPSRSVDSGSLTKAFGLSANDNELSKCLLAFGYAPNYDSDIWMISKDNADKLLTVQLPPPSEVVPLANEVMHDATPDDIPMLEAAMCPWQPPSPT